MANRNRKFSENETVITRRPLQISETETLPAGQTAKVITVFVGGLHAAGYRIEFSNNTSVIVSATDISKL